MTSKQRRVLIIDDDEWLAEEMSRTLQAAGFRTVVALHALEAIDKIDKSVPDVIVLDLFLPGANGLTLLHELKSHSDLMHIPVILCTNSGKEVKQSEVAPYGIVRIVDKTSMTPEDIVVAVRGALL